MIISTIVSLIVVVVVVVNNNIYTGSGMYVYTHNTRLFKPHLLNHRVPIESAQQVFRYERNDNRKRQRPEYHVLYEKHVKAILWNH